MPSSTRLIKTEPVFPRMLTSSSAARPPKIAHKISRMNSAAPNWRT